MSNPPDDSSSGQGFRGPIGLLLFGYLVTSASLVAELSFGHSLFPRSGALLVAFSVLAQFRLLHSRDVHHNGQLQAHAAGQRVDFGQIHPNARHQTLEWVAHTSSVLGTILWGYGDLVFG